MWQNTNIKNTKKHLAKTVALGKGLEGSILVLLRHNSWAPASGIVKDFGQRKAQLQARSLHVVVRHVVLVK